MTPEIKNTNKENPMGNKEQAGIGFKVDDPRLAHAVSVSLGTCKKAIALYFQTYIDTDTQVEVDKSKCEVCGNPLPIINGCEMAGIVIKHGDLITHQVCAPCVIAGMAKMLQMLQPVEPEETE